MKINVHNEYDPLEVVAVSSASYYDASNLAINNETIKYYVTTGEVPSKEAILEEQKKFWLLLQDLGIDLMIAEQVEGAKGQMFTRDLAFAIGDKLFIASMKKENRRLAIRGWKKIIDKIAAENIIYVPSNIYLEGGDIIVDNKTIFVGISERTTMEGVQFLKGALGEEYDVIPLRLKPKFLHLDVVLTIISPSIALIYKDGLEDESYKLLDNYTKIEVTEQEQFELATNVLVVNPQTIIMNSMHERIANELKNIGLNVHLIDLSQTAKDGGAFRCTTCPLRRKSI